MQVNCSKCSQPIALTDTIESSNGHLSHSDCKRTKTLTAEERALIFIYCSDHAVAKCTACDQAFRFDELSVRFLKEGGDLLDGSTNLCPHCRRDLTESLRVHLFGCAMVPSEIRDRARELREATQRLVKQSQELCDKADVLIREAEALLFERQKLLRAAMARRTSH